MTYSRLPSGPSPMTTRRAARRTSGEDTPPPQQPASLVTTNANTGEDEINNNLRAAALRRSVELTAKVATEGGDKPAEARRANSATPTPKTTTTKIIIKNPAKPASGITQTNGAVAKSSSSSPDIHAAPAVPLLAILSKPTGIKKIKLTNKMPTPPEYDDESREIKRVKSSTPTVLPIPQLVLKHVKPASGSDITIKGEGNTEAATRQKTPSDALRTPATSESVSPPGTQAIAPDPKRKRGQQNDSAAAEPPKKRGRKRKAEEITEEKQTQIQKNILDLPKQTENIVGAETVAQLSPDPTGKRKKLAKKLVGNVNLENELQPAATSKLTTMEQQIAQAIIRGMSSKVLAAGREMRQRSVKPSTSQAQAQPEVKVEDDKKAATSIPASAPSPTTASAPTTEEAPKPSAKARGKRKATALPAETAEPAKKRGRLAKQTTATTTTKKGENQKDEAGSSQNVEETSASGRPSRKKAAAKSTNTSTSKKAEDQKDEASQQVEEPAASAKSSKQKPAAKPAAAKPTATATRPKRRTRNNKTPELEFPNVPDIPDTPSPQPGPTVFSATEYDPMPRSYTGLFSTSQLYANSWEESSMAHVDPNTITCPTFGSFSTPIPFDCASFPRPKDFRWNMIAGEPDTIQMPCRCDLCRRTLENARTLRPGKRYFFSYASNIYPSLATEEAGAIPVAVGKVKDHRFLVCGSPLPGAAPPAKGGLASGLPTMTPSAGDEVYGLLYECPDHASLAAMAALAGRGGSDFHKAKVRVELQAHASRRHPLAAGHPGEQGLRTVASVDAIAMRAEEDRYHMPALPEQDAAPPAMKGEDTKDKDKAGKGAARGRGRPKPQQKKTQKGKSAAAPAPQPEPEHEEQAKKEAVEDPKVEIAPLVEGYAEVMNGALAEATIMGAGFPASYTLGVIRKWIPLPQEPI